MHENDCLIDIIVYYHTIGAQKIFSKTLEQKKKKKNSLEFPFKIAPRNWNRWLSLNFIKYELHKLHPIYW